MAEKSDDGARVRIKGYDGNIVTTRLGLERASASYVSRHLKEDRPPKAVSLDMITKVAGRIERMARESLPSRQPRGSEAAA